MSFAEIEAKLPQLTPEQLHRLALKSWTTFVEKESRGEVENECDEDSPEILTALDEAIKKAGPGARGFSASEVRAKLPKWTSR